MQELIQKCSSNELPMIWLRPRPYDEVSILSDDFDFLVSRLEIKSILNFMFQVCSEKNVSFAVDNNYKAKITLSIFNNDYNDCVTLDLWYFSEFRTSYEYSHFNRAAISYTEVALLPKDQRATLIAALYLLHLHHKQKYIVGDTVFYRIDLFSNIACLPNSLKMSFINLKNNKTYTLEIYNAAINYIYKKKIKLISPMRLKLIYMRNRVRNSLYWRIPGVIPFIGPDGSGKSTIIEGIKNSRFKKSYSYKAFKRIFRKPLFHLFTSEPRNVRDEKMLWLILPVAWLYLSVCRWLFGWIKPMIIDRYFYDYYIYNVRGNDKPLCRIRAYKLCSYLTPMPYKLVVCMCRADIVITRKNEMTIKSINSLYSVYIDQIVISMPKKVFFCNTNQDVDITIKQTLSFLKA